MKKITLIILAVSSLSFLSAIMKEDGRAGATASPGETSCNTSGCHNGNLVNSGGGSILIDAPTMTGWEYIPGQVYPINVTVAKTGVSLFGFGFEALRSTGANGGMLSITNAVQTRILTAVISGNVRTNVVHKLNGGATPNLHTFTFNWTAPVTGTGDITFYAAGNAANGNGSTSGDFIYTTSQIVTESTSGLEDIANNYSVQVFPNPAIEKLNIRFKVEEPAFVEIKLVDIAGKVSAMVFSNELSTGDHALHHSIPETFTPGIYFLRIAIGDALMVKRVVLL
ncbi:MAG: T9SS type A sorting domain-containing protein [Bacteroidota bacterium]|nr:T9SS type A sorting domain-containing protein [Bacteroidota bacterium]